MAQVLGEPYFVPVYMPLLFLCSAVEGRLDGVPAAAALAAATVLYAGGVTIAGSPPATLPVTVAVNVAALLLLVLLEPADAASTDWGRRLRNEDKLLALVLALGLTVFLIQTASPVASLRS